MFCCHLNASSECIVVEVEQLLVVPAVSSLCQYSSQCSGICNVQTSKNVSEITGNTFMYSLVLWFLVFRTSFK